MLSFIERLREKSESVRRRLAFGVSFAVVLAMVIFWSANLSRTDDAVSKTAEAPSPFKAITGTVGQSFNFIKKTVSGASPFNQSQQAAPASLADVPIATSTGEVLADPYDTVLITDLE